jgi:GGDEF domain-containing protein
MSIGIASRLVGDSEDAAELFARAQTALVRSKQSGGGGWAVSHVSRP